jgi:hypothetical protein
MKYFFAAILMSFLFVLVPIGAQNQLSLETETEQIINPCFPILPIIRTALEGKIKWHPEWPLEIPPDSFHLISGKAASIQLEIEKEQQNENEVEMYTEIFTCERNNNDQLVQFPVFYEITNENPFMASILFNENEEIDQITLTGKVYDESGSESEDIINIEILEMQDEKPSLARIHRNDEYYFAVFQYWNDQDWYNNASETWYDANGNAEGLLVLEYAKSHQKTLVITKESFWGNSENRITYDYDSWGNISQVNAPFSSISVLYNDYFQPEYLKKIYREGYFSSDIEANQAEIDQFVPQNEDLTFQWDERNLLVTLKENFANTEKRYEYTLDDEKNWTERREIIMIRKGDYLYPLEGAVIRRTIEYSDNP